eukprot:gnl/Chilomastix_caulleri/5104.p2 GENE.gnl/Chilomastix_caulleri/5104~~gnl/Chilomastix_caulleri/5104.p2  ORF type:complete len:159 (+),score=55.80 gnl/Chilomastix_caulleri/5104:247-723(+)
MVSVEKHKEESRRLLKTRGKKENAWLDDDGSNSLNSGQNASSLFPDDNEAMVTKGVDDNKDSDEDRSDAPMEVDTDGLAYNDNVSDRLVIRIVDNIPPSYSKGFEYVEGNGNGPVQIRIDDIFMRSGNKTKTASEILSRNGFTVKYFACEIPMEDIKI